MEVLIANCERVHCGAKSVFAPLHYPAPVRQPPTMAVQLTNVSGRCYDYGYWLAADGTILHRTEYHSGSVLVALCQPDQLPSEQSLEALSNGLDKLIAKLQPLPV